VEGEKKGKNTGEKVNEGYEGRQNGHLYAWERRNATYLCSIYFQTMPQRGGKEEKGEGKREIELRLGKEVGCITGGKEKEGERRG